MGDKLFFASDFHLGISGAGTSAEREHKIVRWLDSIQDEASEIYLVGDIFDYWFEYKNVVPKGYTRLFGKIASLVDKGIILHYFTGNHDMWMFRYMTEEFGIKIHRSPVYITSGGKNFIIGHGDGLGPGDHGYKMIKKIFNNPLCQWAYRQVHPDIGLRLMRYFSATSRAYTKISTDGLQPEKEWLILYAEDMIKRSDVDYFIFGHRHLPIDYILSNRKSRYINLGDWLYYYSYAVFDGIELSLRHYESDEALIISNHLNGSVKFI
jgi:UDP-2,3-diacylglucosamine hydrolase